MTEESPFEINLESWRTRAAALAMMDDAVRELREIADENAEATSDSAANSSLIPGATRGVLRIL